METTRRPMFCTELEELSLSLSIHVEYMLHVKFGCESASGYGHLGKTTRGYFLQDTLYTYPVHNCLHNIAQLLAHFIAIQLLSAGHCTLG